MLLRLESEFPIRDEKAVMLPDLCMLRPEQDMEFLLFALTIRRCWTGDRESPNSVRFSLERDGSSVPLEMAVPLELVEARLMRSGRGMAGGHRERDRLWFFFDGRRGGHSRRLPELELGIGSKILLLWDKDGGIEEVVEMEESEVRRLQLLQKGGSRPSRFSLSQLMISF